MIFRSTVGLALVSFFAAACAADEEAPYSTVTGSVQADSGEALSGAMVRLEIDRDVKTTTTRGDGSFEIALDRAEHEALPQNFFVVVEHPSFAANAIELRSSDDGEQDGPRRIVLMPHETVAASTYTVSSRLAHLGNSEYEGSANSRFQLKQASGESISYAFALPNFDASRFTRAAVRVYARGVESANDVVVNGGPALSMPLTPANGQAELVEIELSPTAFVSGKNELQLTAVLGDYTDVDDFEYAYVEVVFYTSATVDDVAQDTTSCSTSAVDGLTRQIIAELACSAPSGLAELDQEQLVFERAAYRWAQPALRNALTNALAALPEETLTLNSTLRSIAQQYLLRRQRDGKRCGLTLVNQPGTSKHEVGLALDVGNWSKWKPELEQNGFKWAGQSDAVHFTYVAEGTVDLGADSIRAFQSLWNAANPSDPIEVDGSFGAATEERLKKSPAAGFAGVSGCLQR